ncbi:protease complex subunit PrcB family protein [uncultured Flavobacterium sp.]|uniref:protease complex subunit PrcB family protein n=1 Tax=uncultured Flavobacterium sp. TaxID=165435 RepID=UPI0025F69A31|nr:protease complex subunit PrcB family protein [uncultured Flavobacterium sp.]
MKRLILVPFAILLFSCSTTKTTSEGNKATSEIKKPSGSALYEVLSKSAYQGKEEKSFEIIKDKAALVKLYEGIHDTEIPKVDFSKARIVALFLGQRSSGGYEINIKNVEEKDNKIYITIEEVSPNAGDMATMAITNPFIVAKINSTKEIVFK